MTFRGIPRSAQGVKRIRVILAMGMAAAVCGILAWSWFARPSGRVIQWPVSNSRVHFVEKNGQQPREAKGNGRPVYPFSVVVGGVRSGAELQNEILRDPVVAAHYADFDMKHVRLERVSKSKQVFVSYRVKDQVYWTKKRLRLQEGETILTDGVHCARTRCGNRIAESPQGEAGAAEPSEELLDTPFPEHEMTIALLPMLDSSALLPEDGPDGPLLTSVTSNGGGVGGSGGIAPAAGFPLGLLGLLGIVPPIVFWPHSATPVKPLQPSQQPSLPIVPGSPVLPTEPIVTVPPDAPISPGIPRRPVEPITRTSPVTLAPSAPVVPVVPIAPVVPVVPVTPVVPVAPVVSVTSFAPVPASPPTLPEVPVAPVLAFPPIFSQPPAPGTSGRAPTSGPSLFTSSPDSGLLSGEKGTSTSPGVDTPEFPSPELPSSGTNVITPEPGFYLVLTLGITGLFILKQRSLGKHVVLPFTS